MLNRGCMMEEWQERWRCTESAAVLCVTWQMSCCRMASAFTFAALRAGVSSSLAYIGVPSPFLSPITATSSAMTSRLSGPRWPWLRPPATTRGTRGASVTTSATREATEQSGKSHVDVTNDNSDFETSSKSSNGSRSGDVWYFAYGSNLYPRSFGPTASTSMRRFHYKRALRGVLHGYRMSFDAAGVPPFEPAMATVRPIGEGESSDATDVTAPLNATSAVRKEKGGGMGLLNETHGVLFLLAREDFRSLHRSEGFTKVIDVRVEDERGVKWNARTFVFVQSPLARVIGPSARYLETIRSGANYWSLPKHYQSWLASQQPSTQFTRLLYEFTRVDSGRRFGLFSPQNPLLSEQENVMNMQHWRSGEVRTVPLSQRSSDEDKLNDDGTRSNDATAQRELLVYLPGIDGTGMGVLGHVPELEEDFEPYGLVIPGKDRSDWTALADKVTAAIERLCEQRAQGEQQRRKAVLLGESMGGALALLVAHRRPDLVRLAAVLNSATSYSKSRIAPLYEQLGRDLLPKAIYGIIPFVSLPLLIDPVKIANTMVSSPGSAFYALGSLLSIGQLADILQPEVIRHRLQLLASCPLGDAELRAIEVPVQVFATRNDILLPSLDESLRLARLLPNASRQVFDGGGHVAMLSMSPQELQLGERIRKALQELEPKSGA